MPQKRLSALLMGLVAMCTICARAFGDGEEPTPSVPERPAIKLNRWQEDWSVLADPRLRTEPFDNLKYIPLNRADPLGVMRPVASARGIELLAFYVESDFDAPFAAMRSAVLSISRRITSSMGVPSSQATV